MTTNQVILSSRVNNHIKRKLWAITLFALLSANIFADSTWNGSSDIFIHGAGTETNPYLIESANQLAFVAEMVNGGVTTYSGVYFKLTTNINLANLAWNPIGISSSSSFAGNFDGGGFRIYNLYVSNAANAGLFGVVTNATIRNVTVEGVIPYSAQTNMAGGLVGMAISTVRIVHCTNKVDVSALRRVGGLVGSADSAFVDSCYNQATIYPKYIGGGIVGYVEYPSSIKNCCNSGLISSKPEISFDFDYSNNDNEYYNVRCYAQIGGILGRNSDGQPFVIENCYNYGDVEVLESLRSPSYYNRIYHYYAYKEIIGCSVGGIVGESHLGTIRESFNTGFIHCEVTKILTNYTMSNSTGGNNVVSVYTQKNEKYVGGVTGSSYSSTIVKCANLGDVIGNGIYGCGYNNLPNTIAYSYNLGSVTYGFGIQNANVTNSYNAGQTTSYGLSSGVITNSYYVNGRGSGTVKTDAQMKSVSMPIVLNADSDVFEQDVIPYVNRGYPRFSNTNIHYISTNQATGISYTNAFVSGEYLRLAPTSTGFDYMAESDSVYTTVTCGNAAKTYSLSNLDRGTNYRVRFWILADGIKHYGNEVRFSTLACPTEPVRSDTVNLCQGDYIDFAGTRITTAGTYRDSLVATTGCDSVIEIVVNVYNSYPYTMFDTISRGEVYDFGGELISEPGEYTRYQIITGINQCVMYHLYLHVIEPVRNLNLSVNDTSMGTVNGAGAYDNATNVTISAHPSIGHHFVRWSDGSTDSVRSFVLTSDSALTAYFAINQYSVTGSAVNGSVTGSGTYDYGSSVNLVATANEHYHFVTWNNGSTSDTTIVVVTKDTIVTATFAIDTYVITAQANNPTMGSVTGAGVYNYGATATLSAIPAVHHHFVSWSNGVTTETLTIAVAKDSTVSAIFEVNQYSVTVTSNDIAIGSVSGNGNYDYGTSITLTATPNAHCHFVNWSNGATTPTINIVVSKDSTLTAFFAIDQHNVTAIPNDGTMGSVIGGGTYDYGTNVTLTATPNEHYHFINWSNGETATAINIVLTGDTALTANFAVDQHIVTVVSDDNTMGGVSGGGSFGYGTSATITATPNAHYHLVNWSNGEISATINVTVISDSTLTAYFEIDKHTITALSNNDNYGAVAGGGVFDYGTSVTLTATPNEHYVFTGWDNGATNPTLTIVVDKDSTVEAIFVPIQYNVVATANYGNRGVVTGSGSYDYGTTATLTATPNEGFVFTAWSNGATSNTIFVQVESDTALTAIFSPISSSVNDVEETYYIVYSNENNIHINGTAGEAIRIYDINGKLISEIEEASDEQIVPVYVSGVYFVRINEKKSIKVVVK